MLLQDQVIVEPPQPPSGVHHVKQAVFHDGVQSVAAASAGVPRGGEHSRAQAAAPARSFLHWGEVLPQTPRHTQYHAIPLKRG